MLQQFHERVMADLSRRQVLGGTAAVMAMFGFFVTSCGFGLIEQAAHWAANQVDHGDEVGLVPVAACA
jgi:hypothetical protein